LLERIDLAEDFRLQLRPVEIGGAEFQAGGGGAEPAGR
jgi:hypothetical protein